MKRPPAMRTKLLLLLAVSAWVVEVAEAQISVGPSGVAPIPFDNLPPAASWSQRSVPGALGDVTTSAQLDEQVQTNASTSLITNALVIATGNPPPAQGGAMWSSTGRYLATRPITNKLTLLMAMLRNDSGTNQPGLVIAYNFTNSLLPTSEQVPGNSLYWSSTGSTGTWQKVPALSGLTNTSARVSTNLDLGNWPEGGQLYLIWADDNGSGTPDTAVIMDDFEISFLYPTIISQPQNVTVPPGENATLSATVAGLPPLFYQWRKDGVVLPGATNRTLAFAPAQTTDSGSYALVVSNAHGVTVSSNAALLVACLSPVAFTGHPQSQTLSSGETIFLSAAVTGMPPFTYQWLRNGNPLPGATNLTFIRSNAIAADSGFYSVTVANCAGASTSSNVVVGIAEPVYVPIDMTNHIWRYDRSGADLGTAWRSTDFDDSVWFQGPGLFGYEFDPPIVSLIGTWLASSYPLNRTYYFRTTFVLSNVPAALSLLSSNYFDDGAVVYLNGVERSRYNMPSGAVSYDSGALSSDPAGEGVFHVSNFPAALLHEGTNTIAVEVHQRLLYDSDVVFGMSLIAIPPAPTPLQITNDLEDVVVHEGETAILSASLSGTGATIRWFRNGVLVPEANQPTLSFTNARIPDDGGYVLVASNLFNSVTSRVAHWYVLPDVVRPELIRADWNTNGTVTLSFSKSLDDSLATNVEHYLVTNSLGRLWPVAAAVLTNGTNVILSFAEPLAGSVHVAVSGVTDTAASANTVRPGTAARVGASYSFPLNGPWKYLLINTNEAVQAAFMGVDYDDSNWLGPSNAMLYVDDYALSGPKNTLLSLFDETGTNWINTFYFRTRLVTPILTTGSVSTVLWGPVNDGMVLHLNGREIFRFNMPTGSITAATQARYPVYHGDGFGPEFLSLTNLVPGTNVIAVEVHQNSVGESRSNVVMGLVMGILVPGSVVPVTTAARLVATRLPNQLALSWGEPEFTLEQATDPAGPWQPVSQPSPAIVPQTNSMGFFRLRR